MIVEITVPVDERLSRYVEKRAKEENKDQVEILESLLNEWYERELQRLHKSYLTGDITLRGMARRLGLNYRELYQLLEDRNMSF